MDRASHHARRIERAILGDGAAQSALVASWSRSARMHRLDVGSRAAPDRLTESEFAAARARAGLMLRAAGPTLDRLFQTVGGVGCCVMLADANGVPLDRRGAAADDADFRQGGLWLATRWSEADQGTNGIGTCLAEDRAVTIHRDQHFLARNTALSCMTSPVYDPEGRLAGAIDVSSARGDLTPGFATLIAQSVAEAARAIETEAFRQTFAAERIVMLPAAKGGVALLAVDADDLIVGATRAARRALSLPEALRHRRLVAADLLGGSADGLDRAERGVIVRALARVGGNVTAAARDLGISRATLHRKLASLSTHDPDLSQN